MSLEHAVTPVITPSQYRELPSATQPDYENCFTVKKNNSDGLVHTYHVERDTLFPLVWAALVEKINNDFNIDADTNTEGFTLIPNRCDNLNNAGLIPYLEQNHLVDNTRIESKPAWWVVNKSGGYFYLQTPSSAEPVAVPARIAPPPPNTCSICLVPSYVRISNYNCEHHLCCECFENWDNTDGQRNTHQCPECRADCR